MGLAKLIDQAHSEPIRSETVSFRLPVDLLTQAEALAEEIGVTRSSVLRESVLDGFARIHADWERAQVNPTKKKGAK